MSGGDHERWVKANMTSTLGSGTAVDSTNWRTELDRSYDLSWKVECKEHPFFWEEQELWAGFFNFLLIYSLILILWDNTFSLFLINYSQVFASISMYAWYTCWHLCVYVCWAHVHVCAVQVEASVWCWVSSQVLSTVYIKAGSPLCISRQGLSLKAEFTFSAFLASFLQRSVSSCWALRSQWAIEPAWLLCDSGDMALVLGLVLQALPLHHRFPYHS